MCYETADNQFDFFMKRVLQEHLYLVSARIDMLHRHIMWILHSFLILDMLEKTSTIIVETSQWRYIWVLLKAKEIFSAETSW